MSDEPKRLSARQLAHDLEPMQCLALPSDPAGHTLRCTGRVNALEAFAASETMRLLDALDHAGSSDRGRCASCRADLADCDSRRTTYAPIHLGFCAGRIARRARAGKETR